MYQQSGLYTLPKKRSVGAGSREGAMTRLSHQSLQHLNGLDPSLVRRASVVSNRMSNGIGGGGTSRSSCYQSNPTTPVHHHSLNWK